MFRHGVGLGWVASLLMGCGGAEQPLPEDTTPFTVRIKQVGDVGQDVNVQVQQVQRHVTGAKKSKKETTESYVDKVLEGGDPLPLRFQRVYSKSFVQEDKGSFHRTYEGRTIVFERKGKRYESRVEGKPLTDPSDLGYAHSVTPTEIDYLTPPRPVKTGDTWPVDPGTGLTEAARLEKDKSSGQGKLVKVYRRDGRLWGIIEVQLMMQFQTSRPMPIEIRYDGVIDGSSPAGTTTTITRHGYENPDSKIVTESEYLVTVTRSTE